MLLTEKDLRRIWDDVRHYAFDYPYVSAFGDRNNIRWVTGLNETIKHIRYLQRYGFYELETPTNPYHLPRYKPTLTAIELIEKYYDSES